MYSETSAARMTTVGAFQRNTPVGTVVGDGVAFSASDSVSADATIAVGPKGSDRIEPFPAR